MKNSKTAFLSTSRNIGTWFLDLNILVCSIPVSQLNYCLHQVCWYFPSSVVGMDSYHKEINGFTLFPQFRHFLVASAPISQSSEHIGCIALSSLEYLSPKPSGSKDASTRMKAPTTLCNFSSIARALSPLVEAWSIQYSTKCSHSINGTFWSGKVSACVAVVGSSQNARARTMWTSSLRAGVRTWYANPSSRNKKLSYSGSGSGYEFSLVASSNPPSVFSINYGF